MRVCFINVVVLSILSLAFLGWQPGIRLRFIMLICVCVCGPLEIEFKLTLIVDH